MTAARLSKERLEALRHASQNYRDVLTEMLDTYESLAAEADRYRKALEKEASAVAVEWGLRDEMEFGGLRFVLTRDECSVAARLVDP